MKTLKKALALLLVLSMSLSLMSVAAFADDEIIDETPAVEEPAAEEITAVEEAVAEAVATASEALETLASLSTDGTAPAEEIDASTEAIEAAAAENDLDALSAIVEAAAESAKADAETAVAAAEKTQTASDALTQQLEENTFESVADETVFEAVDEESGEVYETTTGQVLVETAQAAANAAVAAAQNAETASENAANAADAALYALENADEPATEAQQQIVDTAKAAAADAAEKSETAKAAAAEVEAVIETATATAEEAAEIVAKAADAAKDAADAANNAAVAAKDAADTIAVIRNVDETHTEDEVSAAKSVVAEKVEKAVELAKVADEKAAVAKEAAERAKDVTLSGEEKAQAIREAAAAAQEATVAANEAADAANEAADAAWELAEQKGWPFYQKVVTAKGVIVTARAQAGVFPKGTVLTVEDMTADEAAEQLGIDVSEVVTSVDINFWLNGAKIQPDTTVGLVDVTIDDPNTDAVPTAVKTVKDGETETLAVEVDEDGVMSFTAEHFTEYTAISGTSLQWIINDGVLTISGTGAMPDYNNGEAPWNSQRASITSVVIETGVTSIGYGAFAECVSLTSVTIGDSVATIGDIAFAECTSLTSVTIPAGVTSIGNAAFAGCASLTSVVIPDSVETIGDDAFARCSSLTEVAIGSGVTSIGGNAFAECMSLTSVTIGGGVCPVVDFQLGLGTTNNDLSWKIINGVLTIDGEGAIEDGYPWCDFLNAERVTDLVIGDGVTGIGDTAFAGCASLTSVIIGNSVTAIGSVAFAGCASLTSVVIPDSVTSIGSEAFSGCTGLTEVTIGNRVTTIGEDAFAECGSLREVTVGSGVTSIGSRAFVRCTGLTSVVIPDSVETIGDIAFAECTGLTEVTIKKNAATDEETINTLKGALQSGIEPLQTINVVGETVLGGVTTQTEETYEKIESVFVLQTTTETETEGNTVTETVYNGAASEDNVVKTTVSTQNTTTGIITKTVTESGSTTTTLLESDGVTVHTHTHATPVEENRVNPTHTSAGSYDSVVYCSVCNNELSRETLTIPATAHHPGAAVEENRVEPTCTQNGSYDSVVYCQDDGAELSREAIVLPATGHSWGAWTVTTPATYTSTGVETRVCANDPSHTETRTIPMLAYANDDGGDSSYDDSDSGATTITDEETPLSEFPIFYVDVAENAWYHDAIAYVTALDLMNGVGDDRFDPNANTTRGMVAVVMMRLANGEAVDLDSFFDVADSAYYAEAAAWAVENGVFKGYDDGSFRGEINITREQFAAVLYRYALAKGYDVSAKADLGAYDDGTLVGGYASDAMAWAIANGIIKGVGGNRLDPLGNATRAQLATMLMRFDELTKDVV